MVKRVALVLLMGFEMLLSWVPSKPVYAASTNVLIYQLQTGSSSSALQEFISFQNNSAETVDVTGWCVTKSSASDTTQAQLGCIASHEPNVRILLPAGGYVTFATNEFVTAHSGFIPDVVFAADLAAASGHVRLLNPAKQEVDRLGWGTAAHPEGTAVPAHASGKILQRLVADGSLQDTDNNLADFTQTTLMALPEQSLYEEELPVDLCTNLDGFQASLPDGYMQDQSGNCQKDQCSNLELLQIDIPDGYRQLEDGSCEMIPLEGSTLIITELLPNATSYDTGKEFVELYNPNDHAVDLKGYVLQLGPGYTKSYHVPAASLAPKAYQAFSDTQTGMVLPNSTAQLRLVAPNGAVVSETMVYASPEEDEAWALIGTTWQYTNQPTPGAENLASLEGDVEVKDTLSAPAAPCPAGQYRSSDTNRCRLITTASSRTPCKAGQERNPETNRCRNTVLGVLTSLVACKEGQERNPETNRCKAISSNELTPCGEGQERNPETNRCRKAGSGDSASLPKVKDVAVSSVKSSVRWWLICTVAIFALGYAVYEWRQDVANFFHKRRARLTSR